MGCMAEKPKALKSPQAPAQMRRQILERLSTSRVAAGLQPFSNNLPRLGAQMGGKDWPLYAALLRHWPLIIGSDYQDHVHIYKIDRARQNIGGTLHLALPGALAPLVQMEIPNMLERITRFMGAGCISQIRLLHRSRPQKNTLNIAIQNNVLSHEVDKKLQDIEDASLKEALSSFARFIKPRSL